MRFGRTLFAVVVTVAVAGCGSSGGSSAPKSAPLEFHDGFAKLDVPLSAREGVRPAVGGRWLLMYGGLRLRGGAQVFDDGVLYDLDAQEWQPVPKAPFPEPLIGSAAAWTGREFVVIGTPCAEPDVDQEDVDFVKCGTTQPVAGAFDPTTHRWDDVSVPDLTDLSPSRDMVPAIAVGTADGRAVFDVVPQDGSIGRQLVAVAPGAEPHRIAPPPVAQERCALDDRLFAFGSGDDSVIPTPAGRVDITRTWTYRDGAWVEGGGFGPSTAPTYGALGGRVTCTPAAIGFVGMAGPDGRRGLGGRVDWFDAATGWRHLPELPVMTPSIDATIARNGAEPLVWVGDRISLLRDGAWVGHSAAGFRRMFPDGKPPALAVTGRYLVGAPIVGSPGHPVLVFLDPAALPPAA